MTDSTTTDFFIPKVLWVLYFCFATCIALIFQKLVLPMVPSLHAGSGLLTNDAIYFHTIAINLADQIRDDGWSNWSLWPAQGCGANVADLSILYVFFEPDPSLAIPINAILHASSGVLIYLIAHAIFPGRVGKYAGIFSSVLFIVFPSSLNWYAQLHKDGYAILGILIVLYSWVQWTAQEFSVSRIILFLIGNIAGCILILSVRPYALDVLFLAVAILLLICFFNIILNKNNIWIKFIGGIFALLFIGLFVLSVHTHKLGNNINSFILSTGYSFSSDNSSDASSSSDSSSGNSSSSENSSSDDQVTNNCPIQNGWQWQSEDLVPEKIDNFAYTAAKVRLISICTTYESNSIYDKHKAPDNILSLVGYLPRAIQIGLFAPFPNTWLKEISITKIIGWIEIFAWYLLVPGIIYLLCQRQTQQIWLVLSFALVFLLVYSYVTPNLGSLHRIRYPFIMLLMLLGALGWCHLILKHFYRENFKKNIKQFYLDNTGVSAPGRAKILYAGFSVVGFTAFSFLLLFYRDVLMGQKFGVGTELDAFFLAMLLPMFIVNVFSIPLGSALIPVYHKLNTSSQRDAESMLSTLLFYSLSGLILIGGMLLILGETIYPSIVSDLEEVTIRRTLDLLPIAVLILVLSIVVILGNAVLNARQIYSWPAIFQIVVPVCAIISLLAFGKEFNATSVAAGMLIGQIINLILVVYLLYKDNFRLKLSFPNKFRGENYNSLWQLYGALAVAALFVSAAAVIDNIMASSLGEGSIGVYSLGNKVIIFVTGVIGAGVTSVVLPRFSALLSQGNIEGCRRDLAFFIYIGTAITIPAGLILFGLCDDVVRLIFKGEMMTIEDADEIGRVAIFGVIQLPFFVSHALLIKFANAKQKGRIVVITAAFGLLLNIVLNIFLMREIGVAGLALATTLSMLVTSFILLAIIMRLGYLRPLEIVLISLSWGLYLTTILCIYFRSYAGVVVSIIAMIILLWEIWMINRENASKSGPRFYWLKNSFSS